MKTTLARRAAAILFASAAISSPAFALTYTDGDLFLAFRQDGNTTTDYLIDIGQASIFRDANTPLTLTLTGLNAQMTTITGSSTWKTDGNVFWGIVGTPGGGPVGADGAFLLYVSGPAGTTFLDTPVPVTTSNQSGPGNQILSMKNYYSLASVPDGTVTNSEKGNPGNASSYTTKILNTFNSGNLGAVEGTLTGSTSKLDLFRVPEGGVQSSVTNEGRFTFGAGNDTIVFTPNTVPEPSSILLASTALFAFGVRRHRKGRAIVS